jgi:hypothetical protein
LGVRSFSHLPLFGVAVKNILSLGDIFENVTKNIHLVAGSF